MIAEEAEAVPIPVWQPCPADLERSAGRACLPNCLRCSLSPRCSRLVPTLCVAGLNFPLLRFHPPVLFVALLLDRLEPGVLPRLDERVGAALGGHQEGEEQVRLLILGLLTRALAAPIAPRLRRAAWITAATRAARITAATRAAWITAATRAARITAATRAAWITAATRAARITAATRAAWITATTRAAGITAATRAAGIAAATRRAAWVASLRVTTATGNVVPLVFRDTEWGR